MGSGMTGAHTRVVGDRHTEKERAPWLVSHVCK
jgi:hypothetical protein